MPLTTLLLEDVNRVRWLTVNRPDKLNALNRTVMEELAGAVADAAADSDVGALVVTGAGEKAFVAGADISEFRGLSAAEAQDLARRGQRTFAALEGLRKPVVAAVNGFALGGGCELAMACHLRIASSAARFGQPEVKLGLIPGYGGTQRLPRLVGRGRALEMLLAGDMIDAETAAAWGLVNRVVAPEELRGAVQQFTERVIGVSPSAVRRCLEAVSVGLDCSLDRAQEVEASLFGLCAASPDMEEGVAAFLEKRQPRFGGS